MTKRNLPAAQMGARPAHVHSELSPGALDRWRPEVRALAGNEAAAGTEIDIYGIVGDDWYSETPVTAARIGSLLRRAGGADVVVNINSPGGDYFEGLAIYNVLREYAGAVTVRVVGIAASAASVIAMAGDTVQIARAGFLMIHNTWCLAIGDRHDLRSVADHLEAFDEVAADLFAARTGLDAGAIAAMLDRETYLSGKAAVDQGFADGHLASDQITSAGANAHAALKPRALADTYMARGGAPRSVRRPLIQEISGTPGAADEGAPGAARSQAFADLLASVKSYTGKNEV